MATLLYRAGGWITRHRLAVLLAWVVATALLVGLVAVVGSKTTNDLTLPGTDSQAATDILADEFPPQQNGQSPIVFSIDSGSLTDADYTKAVNASAAALAKAPHVVSAPSPFSQRGASQLSKDERIAFVPVLLDIGSADLEPEQAQAILDVGSRPLREAGITDIAAGGDIGQELSSPETESSEVVGIVLAMIILSLAFGTIVAMGMPIITAVVGLVVGLMGIGLMGNLVGVPDIAPTLATMIGLGVGIDYSLFLVNRHRRQIHEGVDIDESIALTLATSGSAIVFAGGTVVIALLCLAVAGIPLVTSLGYASAVAVVTAVLAAITLLPALLSMLGPRIDRLRLPAFLRGRPREPGTGLWARWGRLLTRRPWWAIAASLVALGVLLVPVASLRLGQEDVGATPTDTQERRAYDLMAAGFGVGYNGPLLIGVNLDTPATVDPAVKAQEDEAQQLQSELEAEQKEGQAQAAQLQSEAAALQSQQASLEAQQAQLEAQAAALGRQADALRAQERRVRSQAQVLQAELERLSGRRGDLLRRAEAVLVRVRSARAQGAALQSRLAATQAQIAQVERDIAAEVRPEELARLQARLAGLQARAATERSRLAAARAAERSQLAQAAQLRRQAQGRSLQPPEPLRRQARALASEARGVAAQAAALERQKLSLEAQGARLKAQASALQAQAADLKAQQAQLEQLQATAAQQQKQAEALKSSLTATLTKAGGDDRGTDPRLVKLQDALAGAKGVAIVSPPQINTAGSAAVYSVVATTAPADRATAQLVEGLRDAVIPEATAGEDIEAHVGGSTAANVDLASEIASRLPLVIAVVLALSFVVLTLAFRSLLVPLQAAVVNLLCVGAAFGVLVAVFQWGWGIDLLHIDTASDTVPIASYVPLMMFAVLFGLSMDYQVFLLSQVAGQRSEGEDDRDAVARGVAHSAPVITAAALIMIGVFGSFVLNGDPTVKQFGVGLATAVALAGSMVLVIVPALLVVMGRGTWWLPRWLDRGMPHVDIEGQRLVARLDEREEPGIAPAPADDEPPPPASAGPPPSAA